MSHPARHDTRHDREKVEDKTPEKKPFLTQPKPESKVEAPKVATAAELAAAKDSAAQTQVVIQPDSPFETTLKQVAAETTTRSSLNVLLRAVSARMAHSKQDQGAIQKLSDELADTKQIIEAVVKEAA